MSVPPVAVRIPLWVRWLQLIIPMLIWCVSVWLAWPMLTSAWAGIRVWSWEAIDIRDRNIWRETAALITMLLALHALPRRTKP